MKTTSAAALEFDSLLDLLHRFVVSPLGRVELERVAPHTDRARLESDLAETGEAMDYLRSAAQPKAATRGAAIRLDFSSLPDLTQAAHKLRIEGASLEGLEIYQTLAVLDRAADFKSILNATAGRFPRLGARAQAIGEFRDVLRELSGKVSPQGIIADDA